VAVLLDKGEAVVSHYLRQVCRDIEGLVVVVVHLGMEVVLHLELLAAQWDADMAAVTSA
jgi:predicted TIM-barrel fold metal-dependent hydrolase